MKLNEESIATLTQFMGPESIELNDENECLFSRIVKHSGFIFSLSVCCNNNSHWLFEIVYNEKQLALIGSEFNTVNLYKPIDGNSCCIVFNEGMGCKFQRSIERDENNWFQISF